MKVTTEKLPKSLLALDIELEPDEIEKGLDRAARRISQKVNIPGFRKGKAPRFIVENYYGRPALLEEASDDLINRTFRQALEQEQISPVGAPALDSVNFDEEPFHFRVTVPVNPTVVLPDYHAIHVPMTVSEVTDEILEEALRDQRERHVVLKELEEQRPAEQGDQLTVQIESFVDGEPVEEREEGAVIPESTLILEPGRLVDGLYEGLLGVSVDEEREITAHMPDDHSNEKVAGKDVLFKVKVNKIQQRLLPEWDEVPVLEEFEGTLDEFRAKTRADLVTAAQNVAERDTVNAYVEKLVEGSSFDIPDAMIEHQAEHLLEEQGQYFQRYGISLDQMLQYRGQTREDATKEFLPQAEERLRTSLVLQEVVAAEKLAIDEQEIDEEVARVVATYKEEEQAMAFNMLSTRLRSNVANTVLNQKLQQRLLALATGTAPAEQAESSEAELAEAEPVASTADADE